MKFFISLFIVLSSATGFAADLSRATNQELINELARRLGTNPTETSEDSGYAIAACRSGVTLELSNQGTERKQSQEFYVGRECPNVLKSLMKKLGKIRGVERAAFCKSEVTLVNLTLHASGKIEVDDRYVGRDCANQADFINSLR